MEKEDFGHHVAQLIRENNWHDLLKLIHGIGLPHGWENMIKPLFDAYFGRPVISTIIPAAEIPEYQLVWLKNAPPEIQQKLENAIKLSYQIIGSETNSESGELVLPIVLIDHAWVLLLVGPGSG